MSDYACHLIISNLLAQTTCIFTDASTHEPHSYTSQIGMQHNLCEWWQNIHTGKPHVEEFLQTDHPCGLVLSEEFVSLRSMFLVQKHSRSTVVITYVTLLLCENVLDAVSPYKYHCLWVHNLLRFVPSKNSDLERISLVPRPSTPQVIDRLHTRPGNEAREE